jgi:hypothetical protein
LTDPDRPEGVAQVVPRLDVSKPNVARVYDYFLGGRNNFAADRKFAEQAMRLEPKAPLGAQANRKFLGRVVRFLVGEAGVTQLLDIGSGLPTQGNVSEVAHAINRDVRVVHVDNDPIVYTHSKALLANARTTDIITGDIRRPAEILADPVVKELIDFTQPVGLLLLAILHHIEDEDDPQGITDTLRAAMPPGSYLSISSFRMPGTDTPQMRERTLASEKLLTGKLGSGRWRHEDEIRSWYGDWELLPPGNVPMMEWRPPAPSEITRDVIYHSFWGGVARKGPAPGRSGDSAGQRA